MTATASRTRTRTPKQRPLRTRTLRTRRFSVRVRPRVLVVGAALLVVTAVAFVLACVTGDFGLPVPEVLRVLAGGGEPGARFIVVEFRLPRAVAGLLVGTALGASGALFQSVTRNPLGSPDVIGFGSGAATGALIALLMWHTSALGTSVAAVAGGAVTAAVVLLITWRDGLHSQRLIIVGIGIAAMATAVNAWLLSRSRVQEAEVAQLWLTGTLNGRTWDQVAPLAVVLAALLPLAVAQSRGLGMLSLGDDTAEALGTPPRPTRVTAIVTGVALIGASTAAAGPITFVALVAPQIARRLTRAPGPGIATSALTGALLLTGADVATQWALPSVEVPAGIATGLFGGAYLAWLLTRRGGPRD
ncbi:FecCD family ABC transporter permease [Streptomyces uncialis]|uniref:Membrane protein n=1 Tax=Streptomyces uncialis TaxID=1048205 RepID=A0A1Q4V8L5_9ACTN|nr:iron chelate uptake ABC transporter family permease subunit [Streptomyces uncialis]OKH94176.1 membrane protein [Streptomyces uncialis]